MNGIIITYTPQMVQCPVCGRKTKASKLQQRAAASKGRSSLEEYAKNTKRINRAFRRFKDKTIDLYSFNVELQTAYLLDEKNDTQSTFNGSAEGKCSKCGAELRCKINGRVTARRLVNEATEVNWDDYKGLPAPSDRVLGELAMHDLLWLDTELYKEFLALERDPDLRKPDDWDEGMPGEEERAAHERRVRDKKKLAELKERYERGGNVPMRLDYIKAMARQYSLKGFEEFIVDSLERLDAITLPGSVKAEYRKFFSESKDAVEKLYQKDFRRYITAVERLAKKNVRAV